MCCLAFFYWNVFSFCAEKLNEQAENSSKLVLLICQVGKFEWIIQRTSWEIWKDFCPTVLKEIVWRLFAVLGKFLTSKNFNFECLRLFYEQFFPRVSKLFVGSVFLCFWAPLHCCCGPYLYALKKLLRENVDYSLLHKKTKITVCLERKKPDRSECRVCESQHTGQDAFTFCKLFPLKFRNRMKIFYMSCSITAARDFWKMF